MIWFLHMWQNNGKVWQYFSDISMRLNAKNLLIIKMAVFPLTWLMRDFISPPGYALKASQWWDLIFKSYLNNWFEFYYKNHATSLTIKWSKNKIMVSHAEKLIKLSWNCMLLDCRTKNLKTWILVIWKYRFGILNKIRENFWIKKTIT